MFWVKILCSVRKRFFYVGYISTLSPLQVFSFLSIDWFRFKIWLAKGPIPDLAAWTAKSAKSKSLIYKRHSIFQRVGIKALQRKSKTKWPTKNVRCHLSPVICLAFPNFYAVLVNTDVEASRPKECSRWQRQATQTWHPIHWICLGANPVKKVLKYKLIVKWSHHNIRKKGRAWEI